jgi:hypothetical protein
MARRHPLLPLEGPLSPAELRRLGGLAARMPLACTATPRRRRFLFLGLAAPGFLAVFGAPLHQNLAVLVAGFGLFGAACVFRRRTEGVFVRAEAAALWPPVGPDPSKGAFHHA